MKAFLLVFAVGVSLIVIQLKANAAFNLNSPMHLSMLIQNTDAEQSTYKSCCTAKKMEGSLLTIYSLTEPGVELKFYLDTEKGKYAGYNKLHGIKVIVSCDSQSTCVVYSIMENQKSCSKSKTMNTTIDNFWMRCIPQNATNYGKVRIGSSGKRSSLLLQNWMFMYREAKFQRLLTDVDCTPVVDFVSINSTAVTVFYFDITKRIKDPSVFKPPSYCDKANDMQADPNFQQRQFISLFPTFK